MKKRHKQILIFLAVAVAIYLIYRYMTKPNIVDVINDLARSGNYGQRSKSQIDKIIIHHSATETGNAEAFARYHVNSRGWPGIGYHFVVEQDGTIKQTNTLESVSYHTSGQNTSGIGICLTGNFDTQQLQGKQKDSLVKLIRFLRSDLGRKLPLYGHRDFASKSCPGDNVSVENINLLTGNLL